MNIRSCLAILLLLPLFTACDAVVTQQPVGAEVVNLDKATWEGTWLGGEIVVLTTVLDAGNGVLQAAWVERGSEGARFETVTGTVRRTGDWTFLNMEQQQFDETGAGSGAADPGAAGSASADQPAPNPEVAETAASALPVEYVWARVDNDGQRILLWWPDTDAIRAAVSAGTLPGQLKSDDDVLLGPLTDAQLEAINAPGSAYLQWSEPVSLTRVTQ